MAIKPITVSQLNEYISTVIKTDPLLNYVKVRGETSGVKYHNNGYIYFTLLDGGSRIRCTIPPEVKRVLRFELADGMEIVIEGSVNVFAKYGSYQIMVRGLDLAGEGDLRLAFEQLKNRLAEKGLFAPEHKKPLPVFPKRVGVVTSGTGAAVRDILKNLKARNNYVDIKVFPVLVQGQYAAAEIAGAIDYANKMNKDERPEVLIVGRGGGSSEDLWAFNEEIVALSIFRSEIPVISAVGHEIDFTISDMVADVSAETPTKGAVIAVPDIGELREALAEARSEMGMLLRRTVDYRRMEVDNLMRGMKMELENRLRVIENELEHSRIVLEYNNPNKILRDGYSILKASDGSVVSRARDLSVGDEYRLILGEGSALCRITSVHD